MNKSDSINELAASLAKAQGEVENASKTSKNDHFKNRYADLAEVLNTVRPVFAKHGLSIVQFPSYEAPMAHVETVLMHSSGQFMSNVCSAPVSKADAQGVGSAITYLRRYSLAAVCGIAQEDDDANGATGAGGNKQSQQQPSKQPEPTKQQKIDPSVYADILADIEAAADVKSLEKAYNSAVAQCRAAGDEQALQEVIKAKDAKKAQVKQ